MLPSYKKSSFFSNDEERERTNVIPTKSRVEHRDIAMKETTLSSISSSASHLTVKSHPDYDKTFN